jgi:hypothetical protein
MGTARCLGLLGFINSCTPASETLTKEEGNLHDASPFTLLWGGAHHTNVGDGGSRAYPYPYGLSLLRGGVLASKEFPDGGRPAHHRPPGWTFVLALLL